MVSKKQPNKQTSPAVARKASKLLSSSTTRAVVKSVSASNLAQAGPKQINKKTSPEVAKKASKLLKAPSTPSAVKSVSASDLAQAVRRRKRP